MAAESKIEWTDATWNPIVGCSIVSPGCTNCYAMKDAWRKNFNPAIPHYLGLTKKVNDRPVWTGVVREAPDHILTAPLRWKQPKRIFVNSMGDLFHESIPDTAIDKVFAVMARAGNHTFQILTKRAVRMREYMATLTRERIRDAAYAPIHRCVQFEGRWLFDLPLPNVWLGVSAENQPRWNERCEHLKNTPAAVRFVSAEPLLGRTDFCEDLGIWWNQTAGQWVRERKSWIDWIIVGGESGLLARPMHPDWARSIRDQCQAAGVSFFFKQWGEWLPTCHDEGAISYGRDQRRAWDRDKPNELWSYRVGKKAAGRLLDGKENNEFPAAERHAA